MENTHRLTFATNEPEWFVALSSENHSWIGPLRPVEVVDRIQQGQISWAHFAWKKGQKEWIRICDLEVFAAAVPETPSRMLMTDIQKMLKTPAVQPAARESWFLFYNDTQWGPVSTAEVLRLMSVGQIHARVHAWKDGMSGWQRLEDLETFQSAASGAPSALVKEEETREMRREERKPILARILLSNQSTVFIGVCRDISLGGMQVLTDQVPGPVGTRIQLNVSPVEGGSTKSIAAFTAAGVIVRILEDGRGFSFRFESLSDAARRAITTFLS
jgi:hypothetical protein